MEQRPFHFAQWIEVRARIYKLLRSPEIDSAILKCSLAGRYDNPICRTGPPAESIPQNPFLGSLKFYKFGLSKNRPMEGTNLSFPLFNG
jgi:hypothetical protein